MFLFLFQKRYTTDVQNFPLISKSEKRIQLRYLVFLSFQHWKSSLNSLTFDCWVDLRTLQASPLQTGLPRVQSGAGDGSGAFLHEPQACRVPGACAGLSHTTCTDPHTEKHPFLWFYLLKQTIHLVLNRNDVSYLKE